MPDLDGPRSAASRRRAPLALALGLAALAAGCVRSPGLTPPANDLEFPIAAVVSPYDPSSGIGPAFLYVANSNYQLAYNAATLQTYDLQLAVDTMRTCTGDASDCQLLPRGAQADSTAAVDPIQVDGLVVSEVRIGSYADGIAISQDGDRLYLPVRSDVDLTHVDVDPATGVLSCGSTETCDSQYTTSDQSQADALDIRLPTDPVAVTVGALSDLMGPGQTGNYVVMAHRIGAMSLFVDLDPAGGSRPIFLDVLQGLPAEMVTTTLDPDSQLVWATTSIYPVLARVGINLDMMSSTAENATLFDAGGLAVTGVDTGSATAGDTRDIAFDPRPGDDRVYVLSRRPAALFVAHRDSDDSRLALIDLIEVGTGPSRVQVASFDVGGTEHAVAFVSCFDNRSLYVLDPDRMQLLGVVTEMSGPFELQVDVARKLLYVVDFRVSVIRVVDLAPLLDCVENPPTDNDPRRCSPTLLGMIGQPIGQVGLQ